MKCTATPPLSQVFCCKKSVSIMQQAIAETDQEIKQYEDAHTAAVKYSNVQTRYNKFTGAKLNQITCHSCNTATAINRDLFGRIVATDCPSCGNQII